jgi:hypothetical protein
VALLLFFGEPFPLVLVLLALLAPLLAYDLGDVWVGKAGVLRDNVTLVVLAIKYES